MPRLLADENVPGALVALLRRKKIDVLWIPNSRYRGSGDTDLIKIANSQRRTVLTMDKDFVEPAFLLRIRTGVIFLKLRVSKENIGRIAAEIGDVSRKTRGRIATIREEYTSIEDI